MERISLCSREELLTLIEDGWWTLDAQMHGALQNRAIELDGDQLELGGADFWFEEQDYLTPQQLTELLDDNYMVGY
jgi:hypothetical protein